MKFHEEIDQFIEQFKGQIIGQHFQYLLNIETMFMNRGGHVLKTTNCGDHFTFCNPEMTSETCACFFNANRRKQSRKLISIYNKNVRGARSLTNHRPHATPSRLTDSTNTFS